MESFQPESRVVLAAAPWQKRRGLSLVAVIQGLILVLLTANLGRIPLISTGASSAPLLFNDIAVALVALVGLAMAAMTGSFRIDRVGLIGILFATVGAASAVITSRDYGFSTFELFVSLAYLARWVAYFCLYLVLINVLKRDHVSAVWRTVENVLLVFAGFGILQSAFLPNFAQLVYPDSRAYLDWDIQGRRLVSTVLEPNIAAAMLLMGLLVQLSLISVGVRVSRWRPLVLFVALILTLSRSGAVGLIAGVGTILLVHGLSKRLLRLMALVAALMVLTLPKLIPYAAAYGKFSTGGSAASRVVSWIEAIRVFKEHPILGVGFNTFGFVHERSGYERFGTAAYSSDGGLLFIAVLTGVVGLTLYLWMLTAIIRRCRAIWRNLDLPAEHRGLAIGATAVIVGICVDSLFVNSLLTTFVMELFWIISALTFAIALPSAAPSRFRRVRRATGLVVLAGGASACDPCSGVSNCVSEPRLAIEGTMVGHTAGRPSPGVRIDVVRTGGVELVNDSVSAVSGSDGHWEIEVPARAVGDVIVDINVASEQFAKYRVRGVRLTTTDRRGQGYVMPTWVVDPHFTYAAELYYRAPGDVRVGATTIEFHRTGGVGFYVGLSDPVFVAQTDGAGRIVLFDIYAHAADVGELIGDLVVRLPPPFAPDTIRGLRLTATHLLQSPTQVLRLGVGPSLVYLGEFHQRRDGRPAAGVRVTFQRTGGVPTIPETFTATSNQSGRFLFPLRPIGEGPLIGNLTVTPPAGASPFTITNLKLTPYRADGSRLYGVWNVGPYLPWVGLLQVDGRGIAGVEAEFHRTGGIQVEPADYTSKSDGNGYISLSPQPLDTGFVEADITIHSPAPYATIKTHIRMHTVEDDVTGGIFMGWDLDRQQASPALIPRRP